MNSHGMSTPLKHEIHPLVIFNILDHYSRRNKGTPRVVGMLLSEKKNENTVLISNSLPLDVKEVDKKCTVQLDLDFFSSMLNLHQQVYPDEKVVGWYTTGMNVLYTSTLIHNVFDAHYCKSPLLLLVDTSCEENRINVAGFYSKQVYRLNNKDLLSRFDEVPIQYSVPSSDQFGVDTIINGTFSSVDNYDTTPSELRNDLDFLQKSLSDIHLKLQKITAYIDNVLKGKITPDPKIGRDISNALAIFPHFNPESFMKIYQDNTQDMLMLIYLSNLTRVHITLADKISALSV